MGLGRDGSRNDGVNGKKEGVQADVVENSGIW